MSDQLLSALILALSFAAMMIYGLPISIAIAISSILSVLPVLPLDQAIFIATQKLYSGVDSFTLLAIPFFILSGNLMNHGGISKRLIRFSWLFSRKLPGALLHTNVIANMLFGSISGSSVAAAAAIGGAMGPEQKKLGYDDALCAAVNISSAPTGILIPPSGPLILYALVSGGTSVSALFIGGYIPGILMGATVMLVALLLSKNTRHIAANHYDGSPLKITLSALPALFLIVLIIGGILWGIFTATEAAAVAVVYSLALTLLYNGKDYSILFTALKDSAITSASILFLIAASGIMSWTLAFTQIPQLISQAILSIGNPFLILLLVNISLIVVGFFMDLTPAVLIFTPMFLPIARSLGMDPVHFGIMLIFNLGIGNMTPPVGSVLFTGCAVANVSIEAVSKKLVCFFIALVCSLFVVVYFPQVSLFLPRAFGIM